MTNSTDAAQTLKKLREGAQVTYPYLVCGNTNVQLSEDRWKATTLLRRGMLVDANTNNLASRGVKITPTDYAFQLDFITNKFQEARIFAERFLIARLTGQFKFNVNYGLSVFEIASTPEDNVTLPIREGDPTTAGEHKVTANLVLHGFTSSEPVDVQLVKEVVVDGYIAEPESPTPATTRQFMSFTRKWS